MAKFSIESKYNLAYQIASLVSDSIDLENGKEIQYKYFWIRREDFDEEFKQKIAEDYKKLIFPQKETFLHIYIYNFYFAYFEYIEYWFFDDYYNWEIEDIIIFIYEKYIKKLNLYGVLTKMDSEAIESFFDYIRKTNKNDLSNLLEEELNLLFKFLNNKIANKDLVDLVVDEVFSILFINKNFLFNFCNKNSKFVNLLIAEKRIPGFVKRAKYLPQWLKNAIFFRDHGACQNCFKNLSSSQFLIDLNEIHFDHIIPLEKGGTNDPSNFQLLCKNCNLKKGCNLIQPKRNFTLYWKKN